MSQPLVIFDKVVKRFGDFVAVKQMDLQIDRGEFVAIMGPSGCGKTTTLRLLAGLEQPSEGEILLDGKRMNDVLPHERDTPMVWQSLALFPFLNARENVEFGLKMRNVPSAERRARALDWLDRLGIGEFAERDISTLSGGQKQRVALARSLVTEPQIPVAGRTAVRARCASGHPHAVGPHQPATRTGHHFRLRHPLAIGSLRHGRPGGDHGSRRDCPGRQTERHISRTRPTALWRSLSVATTS